MLAADASVMAMSDGYDVADQMLPALDCSCLLDPITMMHETAPSSIQMAGPVASSQRREEQHCDLRLP